MAQQICEKLTSISCRMKERACAARRLNRNNGWEVLQNTENIRYHGADEYASSYDRLKAYGLTAEKLPQASNDRPCQLFRLTFHEKSESDVPKRVRVFDFFEKQMHTLGINYRVFSKVSNVFNATFTIVYELYI